MKQEIPMVDIPVDYILGDDVTAPLLNQYGKFPCRIKAAIFGIVVRGSIRARINLNEVTATAGQLFILIPNTFFFLQEAEEDTLIYYVGFSSNFVERTNLMRSLSRYYDAVVARPILRVKPEVSEIFKEVIMLLVHAAEIPDTLLNGDLMISIVSIITQVIVPLYEKQTRDEKPLPTSRAAQIAREFENLVMLNYGQEHRVNFYADKLNLCLPYLCSIIKEETGLTATQIINKAIITDAKSQLKGTDVQIKSIAYSLGFENISFFNKYFKNQTGMTPKQYRES